MTAVPAPESTDGEWWAPLAAELGIQTTVVNPVIGNEESSKLEVVDTELLLPYGEDEAIVILRVKTPTGRVLEFDMALPRDAIVEASGDYDEVDGELVEHEYDLSKPEEVSRYFGGAFGEVAA